MLRNLARNWPSIRNELIICPSVFRIFATNYTNFHEFLAFVGVPANKLRAAIAFFKF